MPSATIASRRIERALRVFLILFSLFELLSSLTDLPSLKVPSPTPTTGWLVAGYLSDARTVLTPAIAAAAFVFAIAGLLPSAIAAMAVLLLAKACAALAWAFALRGSSVPLDLFSVPILAPRYVYPLLAIAALVLLRRGGRLGLAGTLVLVPTGVAWLYWAVVIVLIAIDPD
jgi:hypothetical protein